MQVLASSAGQWFGRASMVVLDSGVTVLIYREGSGHNTNDAVLHIRFSNDYGQTWTAEDTKLGGGAVTGFPLNPAVGNISYTMGIIRLMPNGRLIILMGSVTGVSPTGTHNGTYSTYSDDDGETWNTPSTAATITNNPGNDTDTYILEDGFVYDGVVYNVAKIWADLDNDPAQLILIKSEDNGATWDFVSTLVSTIEAGGSGANESGIEYLGTSDLLTIIRENDLLSTYKRSSSDFGSSWGTLSDMDNMPLNVSGKQILNTRSHLKGEASWWNDNVLILQGFMFIINGSIPKRTNCIWISLDAGETWSIPFALDVVYEDGGYGDIIYDPNLDQYVVVNYRGTQDEADLVQYNISIDGLPA